MLKIVVAVIAMGLALAGCGGSDKKDQPPTVPTDQRAVLGTIDALQAASRSGDAKKICREIFTPALAASIRQASKRSCEKEVSATLVSPDAELSVARQIDIRGPRATATVREQNGNTSRVSLVKRGSRWQIDGITPAKS